MAQTETPKHIGESTMWDNQEIQWDKFPEDKLIKFEIINFWKMRNKEGWKGMWYCEFVAIAKSKIGVYCEPEDYMIVNIPYKSFERSIGAVPRNKKRFINNQLGNDNVYVEMIKTSKRKMEITKLERRKEDPTMTEKAANLLYGHEPIPIGSYQTE